MSAESTTKIAIIGTGQIGKHHIQEYQHISSIEIVALCDLNLDEARRVAEQYGIPTVTNNYRELLQRDDIVAVDVCLHNNYHAAVTIEALHAGKHVYCEKPIAGSYHDGVEMVAAAQETGKMLHIQLNDIYSIETRAAKKLINEGKLGKVYHTRSNGYRRRGRPFVDGYGTPAFTRKATASGGALYDMGVYHISQMLYLLDLPKVERVSGQTYQEMPMLENRRQESQFDVEELGCGFVKFAGGVTLDILESWAINMGAFEGSSIIGSEGGIRLPAVRGGKGFSYHYTMCDMDMDASLDLDAVRTRWSLLNEDQGAYDSSQQHWAAALQEKVPLLPTAQLALETMMISEGIYLSSRLGREVTAAEIAELSVSTVIKL